MRTALWASLILCSACASCTARPPYTRPAPAQGVASAPANPATLLLTGHGRRVERIGDTLFAVGGFSRGNTDPERDTRRVLEFELPAGPWLRRASTHEGHAFAGSVVAGGRLHAISGTIERYDSASDAWTLVDGSDSVPRSHLAAAARGSKIHVLGGYPVERSGHHVFDVATGSMQRAQSPAPVWAKFAALPGCGLAGALGSSTRKFSQRHCADGVHS